MNDCLAILGAPAAFPEPLHVGRPNLGDTARLFERLQGMLDRRWFSNNGPLVQELEARIASITATRNAIVVTNATIGLEVVARALGLAGEVVVPAYTFVATAHAMRWIGLRPVFADMRESDHNVDPGAVAARVGPRTAAIVATHVWGRACDVAALVGIARDRGIPLLFDAAHAFGASHGGVPVGGFGDAEVFSFHATKFVNAFEGGAITTNDDALASRIREMITFGFAGYDTVVSLGTNAKMSEASAAMALTSIDAMPATIACNAANHAAYEAGLAGLAGVRVHGYPGGGASNYQYVVAEVDPAVASLDRDALVRVLHADGVLARRYFWPGVHRMQPYASEDPEAWRCLPVTERVAPRVVVFPTGTAVTTADVASVCRIVRVALARSGEVKRALAGKAA